MPGSTEMAEKQAELIKKNLKWVESMAQSQYSALQKQYESMQQVNDNLRVVMFCKTIYENLTAAETRMRLVKLIENAMTKCKCLKKYTTTNDTWKTILTSNLLERPLHGGLATFCKQLQNF